MTDDVQFEAEDAPESNVHEVLVARVAKLKDELKKCKAERQEYLDGWQRMRADVANNKRDKDQGTALHRDSIRRDILSDFIAVLDSFDGAMQGDAWQKVDSAWRVGVEYIYSQLIGVLQKHGVETFGAAGEEFNPAFHESLAEELSATAPVHTIVKVVRKGYRDATALIRPAQVVVSTGQ